MSLTGCRIWVFGALLGLSVGCAVDVPDPEAGKFACTDNTDCQAGYQCYRSGATTGTCLHECQNDGSCSFDAPKCRDGVCHSVCSGNNDCPAATPTCLDGICSANTNTCAAKNCQADQGKTCVIVNNLATCEFCSNNNMSCNETGFQCVKRDSTGTGLCAKGCTANNECGGLGFPAWYCVSVSYANSASTTKVCNGCPASCPTSACVLGTEGGAYVDAVKCNTGTNETACNDSVDNDSDSKTDCADEDCAAASNCQTAWGSFTPATPLTLGTFASPPKGLDLIGDKLNHPLAAVTTTSTNCLAMVGWASNTWNDLGCIGASPSTDVANNPALMLALDGEPMVAWSQQTAEGVNIYAAKQLSGSWTRAGVVDTTSGHNSNMSPGISNGVEQPCSFPAVALGVDGSNSLPVAVWQTNPMANSYGVRARYANENGIWTHLGNSSDGTNAGLTSHNQTSATESTPALVARKSGGALFVAYVNQGDVMVRNLIGLNGSAAWGVDLLPAESDTKGINGIFDITSTGFKPAITLDNQENPVVAWQAGTSGAIHVAQMQQNGSDRSWQGAGGSAITLAFASADSGTGASLTWYTSGNRPIIAFVKNQHIYVRQYYGGSWQGLSGSDANNGISGNDTASMPKVRVLKDITNTERVCVAWIDSPTKSVKLACHNLVP